MVLRYKFTAWFKPINAYADIPSNQIMAQFNN